MSKQANTKSKPADKPPTDNSTCPEDYPVYENTARNKARETGKWFYRSCSKPPGYFFLCNADDDRLSHMGGSLNPFECYWEDNPKLKETTVQDGVNKKPPLKADSQQANTATSTPVPLPNKSQFTASYIPLPSYHKPQSPKSPKKVIDIDGVDAMRSNYQYIPQQTDFAHPFYVLNTCISHLTHQLMENEKKKSAYSAVIESSITKTYDLNQSIKLLNKDLEAFTQSMPILIDAVAANTKAVRKLGESLSKRPSKKRKIVKEESDEDDKIVLDSSPKDNDDGESNLMKSRLQRILIDKKPEK